MALIKIRHTYNITCTQYRWRTQITRTIVTVKASFPATRDHKAHTETLMQQHEDLRNIKYIFKYDR